MTESGKAVFLSYASQDAEAAKRICEALRAAGVEVWFDQSELVGGDAWDQKIRKQIKECALLIPVISANTQSRTEGYFRLEWRLADQRTHLMAKGRPFLLPVVVDDTRDTEAHVPDSFTEVQWTRLRLPSYAGQARSEEADSALEKLVARVKKLLAGEVPVAGVADSGRMRHDEPPGSTPRDTSKLPKWLKPVLASAVVVIAVLAFISLKRSDSGIPSVAPAVAPAKPPARVDSEARQLADKARSLIDALDSTQDDYATAEGLVKRALELDATDGEVWATSSRVNSGYLSRSFERNATRREAARSQGERAVKLAPASSEAWLALGRGIGMTDAARAEEAYLRALTLAPEDGRVLLGLASIYRLQNRHDEAMVIYERAAARPDSRALARYDQYLIHFYSRNFPDAERCILEAISLSNSTNMVAGLAWLKVTWRGDIPGARQALAKASAGARVQPRIVLASALMALMARQPEEALLAFDRLPADYISDGWYTGPKALLTGLAHHLAGREAAARIAWESGIALARQRLQESPNDFEIHLRLGELLAWSGQTEAALHEARIFNELQRGRLTDWTFSSVRIHAALGRADDALPLLEQLLIAPPSHRWPLTTRLIRLDPLWDKIRDDPAIQKMLAAAEAAERERSAAVGPSIDAKSVAVLAFANLSEDKDNEYFSDGISEELLTVLQKIPGLKVSARTSAFSFKGRNATAQEIGRTLGVANLVEGSVRKAGSQVRITARLSRADTGEQLWSESYTRELKDVFSVQTELAQAIVVALRAKLLGENGTEVRSQVASQVSSAQQGGTTHVEAHELYLQGKYFANQPSLANIDKAVDYFQRAVDADGSFALAWAALGRSAALQAEYVESTPQDLRERFARARRAVDRALALAPDLADGYFARVEIQTAYDFDWTGARESTERALVLAPSNALVISNASQLAAQFGDLEKGVRLGRQAAELDPVNAEIRYWLARVYQMGGHLPEAEAEFRRAAELSPSVLSIHRQISVLLVQQGRAEAAVAEARLETGEWSRQAALAVACWAAKDIRGADAALARLIEVAADSAGYQVAEAYALRGETDRAFEWLERAYLNRDSAMGWVRIDPLLKNLHGDPRFTAFVRKVGLTDEQLKR